MNKNQLLLLKIGSGTFLLLFISTFYFAKGMTYYQLSKEASYTEATIEKIVQFRGLEFNSEPEFVTHYTFNVNGNKYKGYGRLSYRVDTKTIRIAYLSSNPEASIIGDPERNFYVWLLISILISGLISIFIVYLISHFGFIPVQQVGPVDAGTSGPRH